MRFYQATHSFYCGVDLHARTMHVCVVDADGRTQEHVNLPCDPGRFLKLIEPYREQLVVSCECLFSWYWLADLCRAENICFVLGHALYMRAIHGGKTKNDKIDSEKIARLLRGGMLPQAYVYPKEMRATRDLLRRRMRLVRLRGQALAHVTNTFTQYNVESPEKRLRNSSNRVGVAEQFSDESVQQFASYSRLVKCSHESAGKKTAGHGNKIGNAHLKWAFSEASLLMLRELPAAKSFVAKLEKKHGKAKALSILAARIGRTVYWMLKRKEAFDVTRFLK